MIESVRARAREVLNSNWLGRSTKPAPNLYPHQWSWDSAFIAIGNSHDRWDRATLELVTLFEAQWSTGMVPHIVFDESVGDYFPSPDVWGCRSCDAAPAHLDTSGICQPPVHATAVRQVCGVQPDSKGRAFIEELFDPLVAWHEYLHRDRGVKSELVEIWHPWESGMDNSPAWDALLQRINPDPGEVPPYRRVDTTHADPADRPTDAEYDRYIYLLELLRLADFAPDAASLPFRVRDVLFNSVLVKAERDLAVLAEVIGADGSVHLERAESLSASIHRELWSEQEGMHLSQDVTTGQLIQVPIAGGFVAFVTDPPESIEQRMLETMTSRFLQPTTGSGVALPTVEVGSPWFEPTRYWRGPAWINIAWLVTEGLGPRSETAAALRQGTLDLIDTGGFAEYFNPETGVGCGSDSFSWSAALVIDLLERFET